MEYHQVDDREKLFFRGLKVFDDFIFINIDGYKARYVWNFEDTEKRVPPFKIKMPFCLQYFDKMDVTY